MKKPQKHAEVIKAWADGAEIEYRGDESEIWTMASTPSWRENAQYRVKPEPKPDVVMYRQIKVTRFPDAGSSSGHVACTTELPANVEMLFDGETGELKEIELL